MTNFKKLSIIFLIFIIIILNKTVLADSNNLEITPRNMAMFASISYANLEELSTQTKRIPDTNIDKLSFYSSNICSDDELKSIFTSTQLGSVNLSGETENTYSYLFYNLASTSEISNWSLINYAKVNTTILKGTADFSAMTFKNGNDIVIAYRGTDFNDFGDWIQDGFYGLVGYAGQESFAQKYALEVAKNFPDCNIHLSGHSLGGYLAQIGGAELLDNDLYKNNVKEISYFNGLGLFFFSNLSNNFSNLKNFEKNIDDFRSTFYKVQYKTQKVLTNYYNNGGKITLYKIKGDVFSSFGTHVGDVEEFSPSYSCLIHHHGLIGKRSNIIINSFLLQTSSKLIFNDQNLSQYFKLYKTDTLLDYIWITHETDSFFDALSDNNIEITLEKNLNTKPFYTRSLILKINVGKSLLVNPNINLNCFESTDDTILKLYKISNFYIQKDEYNNNIYCYTLNVRGGLILGNALISLKTNSIRTTDGTVNKLFISNPIKNSY